VRSQRKSSACVQWLTPVRLSRICLPYSAFGCSQVQMMSEPINTDSSSRKDDEPSVKLLVSANELATMLDVSERTIWRLLSAQKIPRPLHIGGSVRWRVQEVNEWIESGCPAPLKIKS
jgi:prophage regulatory protein